MSVLELETPGRGEVVEPPAPLNRMVMAVLALVGLAIAAYMLLYTLGAVPAVACGKSGACESVQASPWAVVLGLPVPLTGVLGYGTLFALALAGVQPRFASDHRIGAALVGFSLVAFLFSLYLSGVEAFLIRAWCRWCIGSAVVATLLFGFALPELPRLRGRHT